MHAVVVVVVVGGCGECAAWVQGVEGDESASVYGQCNV